MITTTMLQNVTITANAPIPAASEGFVFIKATISHNGFTTVYCLFTYGNTHNILANTIILYIASRNVATVSKVIDSV